MGPVTKEDTVQAEPVEHIICLLGDGMADALGEDRLDVRTKRRARVSGERVICPVRCRGLRNPEDVGPLLDVLPEVLWIQRSVAVNGSVSGRAWYAGKTYAVPCQN